MGGKSLVIFDVDKELESVLLQVFPHSFTDIEEDPLSELEKLEPLPQSTTVAMSMEAIGQQPSSVHMAVRFIRFSQKKRVEEIISQLP